MTVTDGGSLTATANLTINVASSAVSIGTHPATQSVSVGDSVTFSVSASNAVSYQWRKGTTSIPNATSSSYTINPVNTGDAGSYDVVVTGLCGNATSNAATLTVGLRTATTTLASSLNPSVFGQSLTLTATVSGSGGTPTGTVTFLEGATTLGTGTLSNGQATLTTLTLSVGSHNLTAQYAGDSTFASSTSSALTQTMNKADQTITFGTLANKTWGDQSFAVSATASSTLAVSFSVVSGPATINNNNVSITGAGNVTIRAAQAGDASYNAATNVDQSFTVGKATVTVTAADKSKTYGDANPALTYTYSGFVNNETAAALSGAPSVTTTATTASGVGSYAITPAVGTLAASNYQFTL